MVVFGWRSFFLNQCTWLGSMSISRLQALASRLLTKHYWQSMSADNHMLFVVQTVLLASAFLLWTDECLLLCVPCVMEKKKRVQDWSSDLVSGSSGTDVPVCGKEAVKQVHLWMRLPFLMLTFGHELVIMMGKMCGTWWKWGSVAVLLGSVYSELTGVID